jgi:hypothetical protein
MVQAAQPWATAKSVARKISEVATMALRINLEGLSALAARQGTLVVDGLPHGWTVEVDGIVVRPPPTFESPLWVMPGMHTVRFRGPLEEEWQSDVTVGPRQLVPVNFPRIESGESSLSGRDRLGIGLTVVGAALGGGGALLGFRSKQCVKKVKELSIGPDKGAYEDELFGCQMTQAGANTGMGLGAGLVIAGIYALMTNGGTSTEGGVQVTPSGITYHFY